MVCTIKSKTEKSLVQILNEKGEENMVLSLFDLTGKTALVTGGSSGIGKGIASAFLKAGANIIIASENEPMLIETKKEFLSLNKDFQVSTLTIDVSKPEDLMSLESKLREYSKIDILVNAAGINIRKPILETGIEDWNKIINVNLRGVYFVSRAVAKFMLKNKYGKIINIGSLTSSLGIPNIAPYGVTKSGVAQLSKTMAVEWAPYIQVNTIAPGYIDTNLTRPILEDPEKREKIVNRIPLGRVGKPEDLYGAALFFASNASDYVTGQVLYVDGGWTAT